MQNRYLSIIAAAFFVLVSSISCQKKMSTPIPPAFSEFATPLLSVSYYIKNDPGTEFKIPIGITNVSNVARKVIIKDSSRTAVAGVQYTIDSLTLTIPAGQAVDSLVLRGIYSAYPIGRTDTLYLKIVGGDVPENAYATTYMVVMAGYCDVVQNDLVGDYTNTADFYGSTASSQNPYTATIANWTSTGATSATITITNLGLTSDVGFGPFDPADPAATGITASLDWSNPSNFTISVPKQNYVNDLYGGGLAKISGSGSFSSCAETFTLSLVVDQYPTYTFVTKLKR